MITMKEIAACHDLRGLSTDEKPTEKVGNGSTFLEMDTGKVFIFDADNKEWHEL